MLFVSHPNFNLLLGEIKKLNDELNINEVMLDELNTTINTSSQYLISERIARANVEDKIIYLKESLSNYKTRLRNIFNQICDSNTCEYIYSQV